MPMIKVNYFLLVFALSLSGLPGVANATQTCRSQSEFPATTPGNRFNDHSDGTLTDIQTGLMWAKCAEGTSGSECTTGSISAHIWQAAFDLAGSSALAGYNDWRLPNINELKSIVERQCYTPAINLSVFPNTPSWNFWSASPVAGTSNNVWGVYFDYGNSSSYGRAIGRYVRLVRSGQWLAPD
jgi:hypothetical protein